MSEKSPHSHESFPSNWFNIADAFESPLVHCKIGSILTWTLYAFNSARQTTASLPSSPPSSVCVFVCIFFTWQTIGWSMALRCPTAALITRPLKQSDALKLSRTRDYKTHRKALAPAVSSFLESFLYLNVNSAAINFFLQTIDRIHFKRELLSTGDVFSTI